MEIKAKVTVIGGKLICEKNIDRICAQSIDLATGFIHPDINPKTYYAQYRVKKELEGYIFREVIMNCGISGHHKTLRACVKSALFSFRGRIFVEDETNV